MSGQRRDDGITPMKILVIICLPLITLIGGLVTYIYTTNAQATSVALGEIRTDLKTIVQHRNQDSEILIGYMANTDARITMLSANIDRTNKNLQDFCEATKQYESWVGHRCDYQ